MVKVLPLYHIQWSVRGTSVSSYQGEAPYTTKWSGSLKVALPLLVRRSPVFSLLRVTVDCMDPTCSGRGVCVRGECHCSVGWGGTNCETPRATCLDQCSGHGTFLPDTGLCSCDPNWTGHDCSIGKCGEKGTAWLEGGACHHNVFAIQSPSVIRPCSRSCSGGVGGLPQISECFPSPPELHPSVPVLLDQQKIQK